MLFYIFLIFFSIFHLTSGTNYRPVVIMHGVTATAADMDDLASWLRDAYQGIYVVAVEIGNGYDDSFLFPMNKQVDIFCQTILSNPNLTSGFNLLGVSQGSLITRGAIERCSLPVHNLISLVGVHQGVFGIPSLQTLPAQMRELVSNFAYEEFVQNILSIAGYWRDPYQLNKYYNDSHFLPDINNEDSTFNQTYRENMLKLNAFVLIKSDIDEVVSPPESSWFLGFQPNTLTAETWNQSRQYNDDLIGMKTLRDQGKLHFFTCHTKHREAKHAPNKDFFIKNILTFFNNTF